MTAPAFPHGPGSGASRGDALASRLSAEQARLRLRSTAATALAVVAVLAIAASIGALLLNDGRWLTWPRLIPALIWTVAVSAAGFVAWWSRTRDADTLSMTSLAGAVEREQSLRAGSLRGALEVANTGTLGARAAQDVAGRLSPTSLAPRLGQQLARAVAVACGAAVIGAALLTLAARTSVDGFAAVVHPIRAFRGTLLPALAFDRLPASVPRGMPLTVRVMAEGRQTVTVSQHAAGEAWRDTTLTVDATTGIAKLALGPVRAPVMLRVADGRAPAAEASVGVDDRGWIGDVALYAQYPAYLGRTNETLDAVSPIRVPRGTRVRVSAVLRGGVTDVQLRTMAAGQPETVVSIDPPSGKSANAGTPAPDKSASTDGQPVTGEISLDHDGTWLWRAAATPRANGETYPPELPDSLMFVVVPDKPPEIIIASPASDTAIGTTGVVPVIVRAGDDHGIGNIVLTLWRERAQQDTSASPARTSASRMAPRERLEIADPAAPFFEGGVTVALDGRNLEPGDRLHVVAIATDDSPWRQVTSSSEVILRVPTLSEQRAMARSLADSLAARALQMAQQEKRLQQNTADASRSRDLKGGGRGEEQPGGAKTDGSKASMSFQAAEKARQLGREQQQMSAKIDSLRQSAKELENRLKSAGALDTALAGRMRDIQKMLRDAMTPEMQKQLEALNKSTERLSGTEAQQSMEQLAQQQQQLRQQLEKSAEMLKRAALEGAMSTLRDEAKELADAQKQMAGQQKQGKTPDRDEARSLADRSKALQEEVDQLAKRLEDAGAKPGASKTRAAQPMLDQARDAMDKAAREALQNAAEQAQKNEQGQQGDQKSGSPTAGEKPDPNAKRELSAAEKAAQALKDEKDQTAAQARAAEEKLPGGAAQQGNSPDRKAGAQGQQQGAGQQQGGQQQGQQGQPQAGQRGQQGGQQGQQGGQAGQQGGGQNAQQAADAMDKAAQQLSSAREAQVDAWKTELSQQLDQSINETMQLARQQADLEQRARQSGDAQSMQGEQGALQQGVQQAAERLEQAGRTSSLLSQRSQKAMADAQRRVEQATQQAGQAGQPGGKEQAQNAMKDASEALNQALSSLVRDRERVNNAQSASGFTEMMEQLKQLAQQQGALNGQMQGLNLLPGGAQGDAAKQQARVLARQQREVAKSLTDVSDADQTGRTDALAKEAQTLAQQIERAGLDPSVAARQQQLYRRLLDAGRFLEQDERDDQGPREAKSGSANGARIGIDGPQSGKAANKFAPPTWNELRGLGAEDRRMVIEYFRRLNGQQSVGGA